MAKKPAPKPAAKKNAKTVVEDKKAPKKNRKPEAKMDEVEEVVETKPAAKPAAKGKKGANNPIIEHLDKILEAELSGVVRYLHYSFMIFGPNRIPITKWFRDQAGEGMSHAVLVGEKITALGGHPSIRVQPVPETNKHNVIEMLKESLTFERETIQMYKDLLPMTLEDVALEEMIRGLIEQETAHIEEVEKMCRGPKG